MARSMARVGDRKSTRLNSSHLVISYAVFCLKKKKSLISSTRAETYYTTRFELTVSNTKDLSISNYLIVELMTLIFPSIALCTHRLQLQANTTITYTAELHA